MSSVTSCPRRYDKENGAPSELPRACRESCPIVKQMPVPERWHTSTTATEPDGPLEGVRAKTVIENGLRGNLFYNPTHRETTTPHKRSFPECGLHAWAAMKNITAQKRLDKVSNKRARKTWREKIKTLRATHAAVVGHPTESVKNQIVWLLQQNKTRSQPLSFSEIGALVMPPRTRERVRQVAKEIGYKE